MALLAWLIVAPMAATADRAAADEGLGPLDLDRVVELALERNAGLRAEAARRDEVAGGVDEAAADAWPQVDLVGNWSRARNPALLNSPDFEDLVDLIPDFQPAEQELWTLSMEFTQPLYTGGKVRAAIDLAELVVDITEVQIRDAELDLALAAAEAWYQVLAARASLDTVDSQTAARQASFDVVDARFELDDATRLEWLRARASLDGLAPVRAAAEGRLDTAFSRLRVLLGAEPGTELRLAPGSMPDGTLADGSGTPAFATLMDRARRERPDLRDLEMQREALERQRVVTVAGGRPQVELEGAYGRQARLPENLDNDLFDDWRVSFGVRWSLFDGGRRKGQVAQLDSRRDRLHWQREDLRRQIAADIEEGLAAVRTARRREAAARIAAEAAGEAARVAQETWQLGVALQADLLDAQDRAVAADLQLTEAVLERRVQEARLKRAVGLLPTASLTEVSEDQEDGPREGT